MLLSTLNIACLLVSVSFKCISGVVPVISNPLATKIFVSLFVEDDNCKNSHIIGFINRIKYYLNAR